MVGERPFEADLQALGGESTMSSSVSYPTVAVAIDFSITETVTYLTSPIQVSLPAPTEPLPTTD